jgi:SAM-dependent methyltransferase
VPVRARFDCLWCGTPWETRTPGDLEGWAQLCPGCLGKAGTNAFLRSRLRAALAERSAASAASAVPVDGAVPDVAGRATPVAADSQKPRVKRRPAWPAFPDDWFLGRGEFTREPIDEAVWATELDAVTRWLDAQPLGGRIAEPAAGVGFFSPLLAARGELHASDPDGPALDRARERLLAHGLRAHLHEADPWQLPPPGAPAAADPADALVAAFLVGRVRGAGLESALSALHARLRSGGRLALLDLRPDPGGGAPPDLPWTYHEPAVLEATLRRVGFVRVSVELTGRFFVLAAADAG